MPPRIRSGLGTNLRLKSWYSLNTPMATARTVASTPALPDRTSSTYCLTSQGGMRVGRRPQQLGRLAREPLLVRCGAAALRVAAVSVSAVLQPARSGRRAGSARRARPRAPA